MSAVGKIQYPQACELRAGGFPAYRPVEIAPPKLRFTEWVLIEIDAVVFEDVRNRGTQTKRPRELLRSDEIKVVRRRVVFGESAPDTSHQTANGQIESRRA